MIDPSMAGGLGGCCCCFSVIVIGAGAYFFMGRKKAKAADALAGGPGLGKSPAPAAGGLGASMGGDAAANPAAVGRMAQYGNLVSRTSSDGFWIMNQFLPPGSVVHYRYFSNNQWVARSVPYQPGPDGHFVYLGAPPLNLQVIDVVPPGAGVVSDDPARTMIMNTAAVPGTPGVTPPAS